MRRPVLDEAEPDMEPDRENVFGLNIVNFNTGVSYQPVILKSKLKQETIIT